jgi:DNA-binding response OmpR family regulator
MAKILVIDDDEAVCEVLELILSRHGHTVLRAANGEQGLDLFYNEEFDLVITDILMPEKEGVETIREMRQADPDVRIIAISGGGSLRAEEYLVFAKKFGADATLVKPIDRAVLLTTVDSVLALD